MKSISIESPALHQRCDSFQTLLRDLGVMQRLHRTAERHARLPPGSPQADELVMEAVEDMIMGDVPCDADGPSSHRSMTKCGAGPTGCAGMYSELHSSGWTRDQRSDR